jgi:hypothetical protein
MFKDFKNLGMASWLQFKYSFCNQLSSYPSNTIEQLVTKYKNTTTSKEFSEELVIILANMIEGKKYASHTQ